MMNSVPTDDATSADRSTTSSGSAAEPTKPITILLGEDILKRLRIIAIVKEVSMNSLISEAMAGVVRKEMKRALAKLGE